MPFIVFKFEETENSFVNHSTHANVCTEPENRQHYGDCDTNRV